MTQSCLSGGVVASKGRESCAFAELPSRQIFNQPFIPSSLPFLSFALQILFYAILKSQVPDESRARLRDFHTLVAAKRCLSGAKNARVPENLAFERISLQCPSRLRPRIPGSLGAAFALNVINLSSTFLTIFFSIYFGKYAGFLKVFSTGFESQSPQLVIWGEQRSVP